MLSKRALAGGVLAAIAFVSSVAVVARQANSSSIVGVWRVSEVTYTGLNARKVTSPQPGLRIFTQRHYSITEVTSDTARAVIPAQGATEKQMAEAFGPFTGQAGTYEIRGNELTTRPIAAKNPGTMRSGFFGRAMIAVDGKTLTITGKENADGPIANPTTVKLTRVE